MYVIHLSLRAQKFLEKNKFVKGRIEQKLENLGQNPYPADAKFIGRQKQEKIFRCRIGDYRALYVVKEQEMIVLVVKIDKRSKIYQE